MVRWPFKVVKVLLSKGTAFLLFPLCPPPATTTAHAHVRLEPRARRLLPPSCGLFPVHSPPLDTLLVWPTLCRLSLSPEAVLARAAGNTSTPRNGSPAPRNRYSLR